MLYCRYARGCVLLGRPGQEYEIDDLGTLDRLIHKVENIQGGLCSRAQFDYYQGMLDLLALARRSFLEDREAENAQIHDCRSQNTSKKG